MRLIVLFFAVTMLFFGGFVSCDRAPSEGTSSQVVRIVETIDVTDSPGLPDTSVVRIVETIGVTDSPGLPTTAKVRVVETISVVDSPTIIPLQPQILTIKMTVTVGSPKKDEVWRIGTYKNIGWTTNGEGISHVNLYYSIDGGKSFLTITKKETNDGNYSWLVPEKPTIVALVRVVACNADDEVLAIGDSGLFTIESAPQTITTIIVTSPETGAVWVAGTTQNIKWATTGEGISYVGIYYSTNGGKSMNEISLKEFNDGVYVWKVPNTPSKTVLVRLIAYNNKGVTLSSSDSGIFSIIAQ